LATDPDTQNRESIFLCLADLPEKNSIPACIRGLEDSSDTVVAMSVKVVSEFEAKEAIPAMIALLKRSHSSGRKMIEGQISAGIAIAALQNQQYNSKLVPAYCGNVSAGELNEIKEEIQAIDQVNQNERDRLLDFEQKR
jgi:HEAT repeat protein